MSNGISIAESQQQASAEITAREQDVARADAAFSSSVQEASEVGRVTVERAVSVVRPVLIGAGLLAGTLLLVRLLRSRSEPTFNAPLTQSGPPLWPALARAATLALASAAGRRLVEHWLSRNANPAGSRRLLSPNARIETQR